MLHMAASRGGGNGRSGKAGSVSQTRSTPGPGRWTYKTPTTESTRARDYQEQVTGRPAWWVYMVGEVEFDGFNGRELTKDGKVQPWFEGGEGFTGLMEQAGRQSKLAERLKLPLVWHVAEAEFAAFLREAFGKEGWKNIDVRHVPPMP